jgi:hypothetical protein
VEVFAVELPAARVPFGEARKALKFPSVGFMVRFACDLCETVANQLVDTGSRSVCDGASLPNDFIIYRERQVH